MLWERKKTGSSHDWRGGGRAESTGLRSGHSSRSSLPLQGVVKAAPPFLCPSSVVPNCQRHCAGGLALPSPFSDEETGSERLTPAEAHKEAAHKAHSRARAKTSGKSLFLCPEILGKRGPRYLLALSSSVGVDVSPNAGWLSNLNLYHHILFTFRLRYQASNLIGEKPTTASPKHSDHKFQF